RARACAGGAGGARHRGGDRVLARHAADRRPDRRRARRGGAGERDRHPAGGAAVVVRQAACLGARRRAPITSASAIRPGGIASHRLTAASGAVAAQPIEENASAKVAMREDTWRRRNWLRLAWVRNQSWIAVAQPAAMTTPAPVMAACQGEAMAMTPTSGA